MDEGKPGKTVPKMREDLEKVAADQHSLATRSQIRNVGFSDSQIKRMAANHIITRVRPNVFALMGSKETWERGLHAALLSIGDPSAASQSAAAWLWTFPHQPDRAYSAVVPRGRRVHLEGVDIQESEHFDDLDFTTHSGIRCTTFERTLCDMSALMTEVQLSKTLNDGLRRGVASMKRLRDCAERLESGPGRHMSVVRALLAARDHDFNPGGSDPELRIIDVVRRANLPVPVQQKRIRVGDKVYRPDYVWEPFMVFAEYYGMLDHTGDDAVIYDSGRLTALAAAGWTPLIFTRASTDREIVERVSEALSTSCDARNLGA
jgi:hypothetical protein